jgi:hypothetical protein
MSGCVASVCPEDKAIGVSHLEKLRPRPERKVFAVTLLPSSLVRTGPGLPIVLLVEQVLIGNVFAAPPEIAECHGCSCIRPYHKWLADIAPHRERRLRSSATKKRLRHLPAGGVVGFGNRFRNHGTGILSRQARRFHHGDGREHGREKLATGDCAYTGTGTFSMISFSA